MVYGGVVRDSPYDPELEEVVAGVERHAGINGNHALSAGCLEDIKSGQKGVTPHYVIRTEWGVTPFCPPFLSGLWF